MKLLFACPTYGPVADPLFDKSRRTAIMFAASHGVIWVGDVSPDRMAFATARNTVIESALEAAKHDEIDGVFWVDDDLVIPVDTVIRLTQDGHDFVSGLYFQRAAPYWPLFAMFNSKLGSFQWGQQYPADTVAPCDGVGFGCVYTSIKLLRAVAELPESKKHGPFGGDFGNKTYGEDFTFCLKARLVGIQPHVDTGVKCQHHIGPMFSNEDLFLRLGGGRKGDLNAASR